MQRAPSGHLRLRISLAGHVSGTLTLEDKLCRIQETEATRDKVEAEHITTFSDPHGANPSDHVNHVTKLRSLYSYSPENVFLIKLQRGSGKPGVSLLVSSLEKLSMKATNHKILHAIGKESL